MSKKIPFLFDTICFFLVVAFLVNDIITIQSIYPKYLLQIRDFLPAEIFFIAWIELCYENW